MNDLEIKIKRLRLILLSFVIAFIGPLVTRVLVQGLFPREELLPHVRGAVIATFVLFLISIRWKNIRLTNHTLQAPVKKNWGYRFEIVDLAEITVSRSHKDKLLGSQISTKNGGIVRISSLFYSNKDIKKLVSELEKRCGNVAPAGTTPKPTAG